MKARRLKAAVTIALAAWALAIGAAAWRLQAWQQELVGVLVQLRADNVFRASVLRARDQVQPEWYRRRALSLLSALEEMEHSGVWTVAMPGSWRLFDNLEERLASRIGREFGDIVVQTLRRELDTRAAALTGVPQQPMTGELAMGGDCGAPHAGAGVRSVGLAPEDQPEFTALTAFLERAEPLDRATAALQALQAGKARPDDLRMLVRYALGADLPGSASRSLALFQVQAAVAEPSAVSLPARLQWALHCSLRKGAGALHTRLLAANTLFQLEEALVRHSGALFEPPANGVFDASQARLQDTLSTLQSQNALLAQGRGEWMRDDALKLGPAYDGLLQRVSHVQLLGPDAAGQLRAQGETAWPDFRKRFRALFGRPGAGVVWFQAEGRYAQSPERRALREGLEALLMEPFMAAQAPAIGLRQAALFGGSLGPADMQALVDQRRRFVRQALPRFPQAMRPAVMRFVDERIGQLAFERAVAMAQGQPIDTVEPAVKPVLAELGGSAAAGRLRTRLDRELNDHAAPTDRALRSFALFEARAADLGWWQGEPAPLRQLFGAADDEAMRRVVPTQAARLDAMLAGMTPASDPGNRVAALQAELQRYRARQPDSSLLALDEWLTALGGTLRRDNCAELLAAHTPLVIERDEIARRHLQLHNALQLRCAQLRTQPMS